MSDDDELAPVAVPLDAQSNHNDIENTSLSTEFNQSVAVTANNVHNDSPPPVPVTLITGHLGSGKTTLVNYILTAKHGYRCAVLLNEIGDSADIEKALIKEPEEGTAAPLADWIQLENGCICCSVKNDMVKALESLLQQRQQFDYILIETTGLANPGPVAAALWTDPNLEAGVCLDSIVTVVDAKHIRKQLDDPRPDGAVNEAQQQVAFADIIILNKIDLLLCDSNTRSGEKEVEEVEECVRSINSEVDIVKCTKCKIDLGRILNTGLYSKDADKALLTVDNIVKEEEGAGAGAGGGGGGISTDTATDNHHHDNRNDECGPDCSDHSHHHHHHDNNSTRSHHSHQIGTITLYIDGHHAFDMTKLRHWLDELLWEQQDTTAGTNTTLPPEIFRIKGLVYIQGNVHQYIVQAVHELYDIVQGKAWINSGGRRRSKFVFIGRRLNREELLAGLMTAAIISDV
jgi:G3E family GTPase